MLPTRCVPSRYMPPSSRGKTRSLGEARRACSRYGGSSPAIGIASLRRSAILASAMLPPVLSFPPFRLDVADERLWRDDTELKLRRKPFAILKYLATHPKRLVTQDDLIEAVWGKVVMSESLLRTHMRDLRQVIGDSIIETVVGRGYRFIADVCELDGHAANGATAMAIVSSL